MAVKASGAISFATDIVGEFGGTAPYAMSDYYRGGSKVPNITDNNSIGASGLIRFGGFYSALNEILQALTGTNISLSSIFGSDWTATTPKRATIASGVTIGGTGGTAAITIESTMGGTITIVITGSVLGTGGAGGGAGGDAISCAVSGVTLEVESGGLLAGGGGGGGAGGSGGNGNYQSNTAQQSMSQGYWGVNGHNIHIRYDHAQQVYTGHPNYLATIQSGAWGVYRRGGSQFAHNSNGWSYYKVYKVVTNNTTGGTGGSGGVGQGYNQTNASGSAGSSGGTNAGAGGTGGSGGTYGSAGSTGGTGANGNSSNGSSGSSGGAAGAALSGTALSSYTNNGTVNGTVST